MHLHRGKLVLLVYRKEFNMTIEEIQKAIKELSPNELALFRKWFSAFDAKQFTREEDIKKLQGSLKGKGILKAFMEEKKRERDL
jgi:hypothetical protein